MANVVKVLKAEISRVSRKEAKSAAGVMAKSLTDLKKVVLDLRRRIAALEKEKKRPLAGVRRGKVETPPAPSKDTKKAGFTSTSIKSLRSKLRLSQAAFAKLVGVTPYSVSLWENKEGPLNLRDKTRAALLSVRSLNVTKAKDKPAKRRMGSKGLKPKTREEQ
ncbi:MAG: hypothetical protein JW836_03225 [Deltaproteobacteria bacterium]|nr:hypothetical protein [Deltaproteobacteria bacterium]